MPKAIARVLETLGPDEGVEEVGGESRGDNAENEIGDVRGPSPSDVRCEACVGRRQCEEHHDDHGVDHIEHAALLPMLK
jgi:hypothetical protein